MRRKNTTVHLISDYINDDSKNTTVYLISDYISVDSKKPLLSLCITRLQLYCYFNDNYYLPK